MTRSFTLRVSHSSVECSEPIRLFAHFAQRRACESMERRGLDTAGVVAPDTRDRSVDEKRAHRVRSLGREHERTVLLGKDPASARMNEQRRVPRRQEANGSGRLRIRERRPRKVEELLSLLVAKTPQASCARARDRAMPSRPSTSSRCRSSTQVRIRRDTAARDARLHPPRSPPASPPTLRRARRDARDAAPRFPTAVRGSGRASARIPRSSRAGIRSNAGTPRSPRGF